MMGTAKLKRLKKAVLKILMPININVSNVTLAPNELLKGKNAIVTGGGSGIGKAISKTFVASGATVVALGRNEEKLNKVRNEIKSEKFIPFSCDISDVENISKYMEQICGMFTGRREINILINCAGVFLGTGDRFFDYTPKDFDDTIGINLKGMFFWCQAIANHMIERKISGHIVNISSILGVSGDASPYGVSKWGVTGFTKGLAKILAPQGIVVNGIAPGYTNTDMGGNHSSVNYEAANMRWAESDEIANLALFLASDLGSNIVGEVVVSDGGTILLWGNRKT